MLSNITSIGPTPTYYYLTTSPILPNVNVAKNEDPFSNLDLSPQAMMDLMKALVWMKSLKTSSTNSGNSNNDKKDVDKRVMLEAILRKQPSFSNLDLNLTAFLNKMDAYSTQFMNDDLGGSRSRHRFNHSTEAILITIYTLLSFIGTLGNGLVLVALLRNKQMRNSPRNAFIGNLAASDLILCLFTSPFTLSGLIKKDWTLGLLMCRFVSSLQATNVFVSTMSITAIAVDRHQVILYPMAGMGGGASAAKQNSQEEARCSLSAKPKRSFQSVLFKRPSSASRPSSGKGQRSVSNPWSEVKVQSHYFTDTLTYLNRLLPFPLQLNSSCYKGGGVTLGLFVIWLVSLIMATPLFVFHSVMQLDLFGYKICYENWPNTRARRLYSMCSLLFQYVLPIALVTISYVRIALKLRAQARNKKNKSLNVSNLKTHTRSEGGGDMVSDQRRRSYFYNNDPSTVQISPYADVPSTQAIIHAEATPNIGRGTKLSISRLRHYIPMYRLYKSPKSRKNEKIYVGLLQIRNESATKEEPHSESFTPLINNPTSGGSGTNTNNTLHPSSYLQMAMPSESRILEEDRVVDAAALGKEKGAIGRAENIIDTKRRASHDRRRRKKRTNLLLLGIAVVFAVSWLPLNVFNLLSDLESVSTLTTLDIPLIYACCHLVGMSSACSNPILYGWLNDNFKKEFKIIFYKIFKKR